MKKLVITLLLAGVVSVPLAAEEKQPQEQTNAVMQEMHKGHEAFAKARKEHRAKMKATQEKMEKLVKEYNTLKDGKKKDAKRAEIEKEVGAIHEEQLKFKQEQLVKFEERLAKMKTELAEESSADGKKAWVAQKTDALVDNKGDLRVLFDPRPGMLGPGMGRKGPHGHPRHFGKGPRMAHPKDAPDAK